jgi:tetratricopeptide (TPR) repeat protein
MTSRFFLLLCLPLLIAAAKPDRYSQCLSLARTSPEAALEQATIWRSEGGKVPAMHCQAVALIEQGNPSKAAGVLDAAAQAMGAADKKLGVMAGEIWAQAGNAWLLAGDTQRAETRLTTALGLLPDKGDARVNALIDRARARSESTDWPTVIEDLDTAARLAPSNATIFLLRATAKRRSGDLGGARTDILMAGTLAPDNVVVLVERGISHAQSQQLPAAFQDWHKVIVLAPDSDEAKIARGYLDQLEPKQK